MHLSSRDLGSMVAGSYLVAGFGMSGQMLGAVHKWRQSPRRGGGWLESDVPWRDHGVGGVTCHGTGGLRPLDIFWLFFYC